MKLVKANTPSELINKLSKIKINVPKRTNGRKTYHTEWWALSRFLATYYKSELLNYPIEILHRDKPDFRISALNKKIGIEFTESIPEQYAYIFALAEKYVPDANIEPSMFTRDAPKRGKQELIEILERSRTELMGLPISGNKIERDWSEWINDSILNKTKKLNLDSFKKYDLNYLLIYDNLPNVANNTNIGLSFLKPFINDYYESKKFSFLFDRIFLITDNLIININKDSILRKQINNIW